MWRAAFLLLLTASPGASAASVSINLGESVAVNGGRLTLLSVEDTRCPPKALCLLSAGHVKAELRAEYNGKTQVYLISLPGPIVDTPLGKVWLKTATKADRTPTTLTFEVQAE